MSEFQNHAYLKANFDVTRLKRGAQQLMGDEGSYLPKGKLLCL